MERQRDVQSGTAEKEHPRLSSQADLRFGSNAVRLSAKEWAVTGLILVALALLAPVLWSQWEEFQPGPDYRIPYDLSGDYWLFNRYANLAAEHRDILAVGDSVIWGQYVTEGQTLTHHLNRAAGGPQFANLGMDGMHPAALAGLLEYYGGGIRGRSVLLNAICSGCPRRNMTSRPTRSSASITPTSSRSSCRGSPATRNRCRGGWASSSGGAT